MMTECSAYTRAWLNVHAAETGVTPGECPGEPQTRREEMERRPAPGRFARHGAETPNGVSSRGLFAE